MITKTRERIILKLYDENLKNLTNEIFEDVYTLNFFLQTIPKTFDQVKTLLIFNDLEKTNIIVDRSDKETDLEDYDHNVKLILAKDENSYSFTGSGSLPIVLSTISSILINEGKFTHCPTNNASPGLRDGNCSIILPFMDSLEDSICD